MNLAVGAAGILGNEICRLLAAEGKPIGALVKITSDQMEAGVFRSIQTTTKKKSRKF